MNNLIKTIVLIFSILVSTSASAQKEQKGYVKTRGRMVNGVHVPGKGLTGAVVFIKDGNNIGVREADGSFSFPVRGDTYTIQSVSIKGYVMVDADALPETYGYSSNPLYLVMDKPDQLLDDQLAAETRIRKALQRQLAEREDELKEMRQQAKITQEEYRVAMQELYEKQGDEEKLIHDMAKRYSVLDYDQLDDFYRRVSSYVEHGELLKADSLLRSRGNLDDQIEKHLKSRDAIIHKEEELEKVRAVHQHDLDEMAQRCCSYFENFSMQHQLDSAAHYLQLRAKLDTTNIEWQSQAGLFTLQYIADYELAMKYFMRSLDAVKKQPDASHLELSIIYNNIGYAYHYMGDYARSEEYFSLSLETMKKDSGGSSPDIGTIYNNSASIYDLRGDYKTALDYYVKALDIWKNNYGESNPDVALSYNNIGYVNYKLGDYVTALEYYYKSSDIWMQCYGESSPRMATVYNNIGMAYEAQGDNQKASEYLKKSLEIRKLVYDENHPDIAVSYGNLGQCCFNMKDYAKALEYFTLSLNIKKQCFGDSHPETGLAYNSIGIVCYNSGDYELALESHLHSLEILRLAYGDSHEMIATLHTNVGSAYLALGNYSEALSHHNMALNLNKQIHGELHQNVLLSYMCVGLAYIGMGNLMEGLQCLKKCCELALQILGPDNELTLGMKTQIEQLEAIIAQQNGNETDGQ